MAETDKLLRLNPSEDLDSNGVMAGEFEAEIGMDGPRKKTTIRSTGLRWLMLVFGCWFLMGSYYCYDIPASLSVYL
jgi:hypothetical protein